MASKTKKAVSTHNKYIKYNGVCMSTEDTVDLEAIKMHMDADYFVKITTSSDGFFKSTFPENKILEIPSRSYDYEISTDEIIIYKDGVKIDSVICNRYTQVVIMSSHIIRITSQYNMSTDLIRFDDGTDEMCTIKQLRLYCEDKLFTKAEKIKSQRLFDVIYEHSFNVVKNKTPEYLAVEKDLEIVKNYFLKEVIV